MTSTTFASNNEFQQQEEPQQQIFRLNLSPNQCVPFVSNIDDTIESNKRTLRLTSVKDEPSSSGDNDERNERTKNGDTLNFNEMLINELENKNSNEDERRFNHCSDCHDRYQFGNRSTKKVPDDVLKLGILRYDELFSIATFYTRNGFLTIAQVNKLMTFLEEDYPEAEWNLSKIRSSNEELSNVEKASLQSSSASSLQSSSESSLQSSSASLKNKSKASIDDSSILALRFKRFYRYECLLRSRKVSNCKSYVTCLALFSKLRQIDKRHLISDCSFYTKIF